MYSFVNLREIAAWDRFELEAMCRAQAQSAYLGDYTGLCRILGRYKFYVDTRDRDFGSNILLDGFWEMWLTQFIARTVKPGMVVADVGAGYGYYSVLLADLVGPDGHVYAVEPDAEAASWLRRSLALNGFERQTTVCDAALADCSGRSHGAFSLDGLTSAHGRVDFLRIRATGAEETILGGISGIIRRDRPGIVLEFHREGCTDPAGFLGRLREHYPRLQQIDHAGHAVPISADDLLAAEDSASRLLFLEA